MIISTSSHQILPADFPVNSNLQQEPPSSDIIMTEQDPKILVVEEQPPLPDFQGLVDQIDCLARYPQLVDASQVASLPVRLNEALQRAPCLLLEDYQIRIVQLRKILSQVEQFPFAERLVTVLNQHLIHTEQAAQTLYLNSATPVQDSLWPLYERILRLPTLEPDLFGAAVASLHEKLPYADSSNVLTDQLKGLLPNLQPPACHLWKERKIPFEARLQNLEKIKMDSLTLLHRLNQAPEGYIKKHFLAPIERVFCTYRDFLEALYKANDQKRQEMCIPQAQLSGPGLGFFVLDQSVAHTLISRDERGKLCKKNALGTHAVHCEAGIFYKPNSDNAREKIHTETEFAIYALYQRLGREGVAPTALAKVSHLFFEEQPEAHGRTLQAGYGIEGMPLQDLLDIANVLPFLTDSLGSEEAQQAFLWLMEKDWKKGFVDRNRDLSSQALSSLALEASATRLVDAFEALFAKEKSGNRCLEFYDRASVEATRDQFVNHLKKGSRELLVGCIALLERYPTLAVTSSKDTERFKSGVRRVSYEELMNLQLSVNKIKALFPNLAAKQLLVELPELMRRFDSADFSTHFVATLLTNPTDYRVDNLMVTLTKNEQGGVQSFSLVGIDNDLAFAFSEGSVRTMLYLFPSMNMPFDPTVAQQLLKVTPEEFVLDWLIALEEQNQSYERWQNRGVLVQDGLPQGNSPHLDIPLKIDRLLIPTFYAKAKQLQKMLATSSFTHWELLNSIQPRLASVYDKASKLGNDPIMAYGEIARLVRQEKLNSLEEESTPPFSTAIAALQFLKSFDLGSFPVKQQVSLIGKALHTFPSAASTLTLPGDPADPRSRRDFFLTAVTQGHCALVARLLEEEKKSRLGTEERPFSLIDTRNEEDKTAFLIACFRLDLEMIKLLLHYGADSQAVDIENQGALTLCLLSFPKAPMRAAAAIRLLGDQCVVSWNVCSNRFGFAPLHYLVERASKAPEEAEPLIAYLIGKGANPDLVDNHNKTPLDYAIKLGQERLIEQLIRLGAGRTLSVEPAIAFFNSHAHLKDTFALLQNNSLLLRWHLALGALRRVSSSGTQGSLEGAQLGRISLALGLTKRLLDKTGDISPQIMYGRRNVNKLTLPGGYELFFKQYPEMPGVEYAIDTLFGLLIGHGTSFTDFARLTPANGNSYPVLISQGIQGENLHDVLANPDKAQQLAEKLDPLAFSELLLASLLVNFEDAKPDNFIVELLPSGTYRLVGIDNDHAFVPPLVKEGRATVQVKCILYCLEQMKQPLHPCARERFLSFAPERLLRLWLNKLQEHNQRYCNLFSEAERAELFKESKKNQGMVIPIPFKPGAIVDIYQKFRRLQIALQEPSPLTGLEVLRLVIPSLGIRYEEAFYSHNSPLERFLSLTKTQYSQAIKGRYQTLVNSRQLLISMAIPDKQAWTQVPEQGPHVALAELDKLEEEMHATGNKLHSIRNELQAGNIAPFDQLQLDTSKEKVINGIPGIFDRIDFKTMRLAEQKNVLSAILAGNYRALCISGCAVFDKAAFDLLVRHSPQLLSLELRGCPKIDQNLFVQLSQLRYLTQLRLIDLPQLKQLVLPHPTLRRLEIMSCQGLQKVTISDTMKDLSIESCWNLSSITAKSYEEATFIRGSRLTKEASKDFVLQKLRLKACPKLQPWWGMFKDWLKESLTNEIQLQNVPPNPSTAHVGSIAEAVLTCPQAKEMLTSLENYYEGENVEALIYLIGSDQDFLELDLDDYGNEVSDNWIRILSSSCSGRTKLSLSGCHQITDESLKALSSGCPNLTTIWLNGCNQITNAGVKTLALGCPGLNVVSLSGCTRITDAGVKALASSCPGLTIVGLANCTQITDTGLGALAASCPGLTIVNLSGCNKITNASLVALSKNCPGLTNIYLKMGHYSASTGSVVTNKLITDAGVGALASGCPGLTEVNLSGCDQITDASLVALSKNCPGLTAIYLDMRSHRAITEALVTNKLITDTGVMALVSSCHGLTKVDLSGCDQITNASLAALSENCPGLTMIYLNTCSKITDAGLLELSKSCSRLTRVHLNMCRNWGNTSTVVFSKLITDMGVEALSSGCPALTEVVLDGCERITNASLVTLSKDCPGLTTISLDWCSKITDTGLLALSKGCPDLTEVSFSNCDSVTSSLGRTLKKEHPNIKIHGYRSFRKMIDEIGNAFVSAHDAITSSIANRRLV